METFENLIPELHKQHYVKENTTNQIISIYKNNRYDLSATITLNHNTGNAIFTFKYLPIMPFKLECEPIPNANQNANTIIEELETFNQMIYVAVNRLTKHNSHPKTVER
jgi:hypothetical protein